MYVGGAPCSAVSFRALRLSRSSCLYAARPSDLLRSGCLRYSAAPPACEQSGKLRQPSSPVLCDAARARAPRVPDPRGSAACERPTPRGAAAAACVLSLQRESVSHLQARMAAKSAAWGAPAEQAQPAEGQWGPAPAAAQEARGPPGADVAHPYCPNELATRSAWTRAAGARLPRARTRLRPPAATTRRRPSSLD